LLHAARLLQAAGLECVAALRDIGRAAPFAELGCSVIQAPAWPVTLNLGSAPERPATSASMGDMLAHAGLAHEAELASMIAAWRAVMQAFRIDFVVADFAPGAALAARGLLPVAMVGNGYCQPPGDMPEFPPLHHFSAPHYEPERVLETVNGVLRKAGSKPLQRLPQVFESDASLVTSLPALDPYRAMRSRPADGPVFDPVPELASRQGTGIFAYLSPGFTVGAPLIETLAKLGSELAIFAPALHGAHVRALAAGGARIEERPIDLTSRLREFALAVHYGVGGTSALAMLAGVPQLALSLDIEKDLNGQAIEEAGCGKLIMLHRPGTVVDPELIRSMAHDSGLAERARATAAAARRDVRPERVAEFVSHCVSLAG
jgi:UDP:flavonoid glycosyltransferase YjiC (YdhE family)